MPDNTAAVLDRMHSGFYWAHCTGPDGPVVLLIKYDSRTKTFDIIEDGRTEQLFAGHLHKWHIHGFQVVERPRFDVLGCPFRVE